MTALYVPGVEETDPQKIIRSQQLIASVTTTNTANIATNTTNIATNTTNIATNTTNIATNTTNIATNTASIAALQTAWSTWTPTVIPGAGAFTTASASGGYFVIGKLVHFSVTITITTVGTASGAMTIALPIGTAARPAMVPLTETAVIGNMGYGRIASGGTTIFAIDQYNNASYIAAGAVVTLTGIYEKT